MQYNVKMLTWYFSVIYVYGDAAWKNASRSYYSVLQLQEFCDLCAVRVFIKDEVRGGAVPTVM